MNEIEKIKFHLNLLAESIDSRKYPIPSLVISLDWGDDDLSAAHDIFQKMDEAIDSDEPPNWTQFEMDFKSKFGMDYQNLKLVVLSFFRNGQWIEVCASYAAKKPCIEFDEINKRSFSSFERDLSLMLDRANIQYESNVRLDLKNGSSFEVDFMFTINGKRTGVEAKIILTETVIPKLISHSKSVAETGMLDNFIVVANATPQSAREKLLKGGVQVFLPKEFEKFILTQ